MPNTPKRTLAVSRPVGKGADTADLIKSLGWTPLIFHTVDLKPLDQRRIWDQVQAVLPHGSVDWIVFMSSAGVKLFLDNLTPHNRQILLEGGTRFLAVGPRTRESLVQHGVADAEIPAQYSSEGIGEWFAEMSGKPARVMLFRSSSADDSLCRSLQSQGAVVTTVNLYESVVPEDLRSAFDFLTALDDDEVDAVLFTSSISVSNLFKIAAVKFEENRLIDLLRRVSVGAIGPATAREIRRRGIEPTVPGEYLIESALKKLTRELEVSQS